MGIFTSIEGWGGSEIFQYDLILRLRDIGHEPVLFGVESSRLFSELRKEGIRCVAWKRVSNAENIQSGVDSSGIWRMTKKLIPSSCRLLVGSFREVLQLVRIFKTCFVDVMLVGIHGYEVAGVACRLCGIPCIGDYHTWPVDERWWIRRLIIKVTAHSYNICMSVSRSCIEAWRKYCKLAADKCCFVLNGIDIEKFKPRQHAGILNKHNEFRILAVGRLHPMKGFDVLIRAIAELKDENITLTIAGEGDERKHLELLANELGIAERVIFLGYIEDTASLYPNFDCFVLPSVSHEACPLAIIEAMACRLPVITSDFGPLPELNSDDVTGLVVPAGNSKKLADAIRRLASSEQLRLKFGNAALERARRDFTRERMMKEIIAICEEIG